MRLKTVAFTLACALVSTSANAGGIASTSLCGDGYVLAMTPVRVSALSWQSRDTISRAPENMRELPQAWDDIERLIALSPDVVIFGAGEGVAHSEILAKTGMETVSVKWGEDFETVRLNYQDIAKQLGVSSERHIEDLNSRLDTLKTRSIKRGTKPTVFYIARSGGTGGPGTFIDAAITAAGGTNVIKTPGWVNVDIENALKLDPDLIVTSYFTDGYESIQAAGVRNKVLSDFINAHPNVDIPGALWPCAGPGLIEAAERMADALDALP